MDYYSVLGLEPGATPADIKRAYRRLARRYHPGINPGDRTAEALFQRITEAYETLVDPDRRRQYDSSGGAVVTAAGGGGAAFEFAGFDFTYRAQGPQAATFTELFAEVLHPPLPQGARAEVGPDIHASLTISFEDAIRGVERQVVVTRNVPCGGCAGAGQVRTIEGRCPHCQATGKVRWARGHMVFSKACAACGGTGRMRQQRCDVCSGSGRTARSEAVLVPVPPGTYDGTQVRLSGRGHAGRNGGRMGDLSVDVRVRPHATLRREGDDLFMPVPIAPHEAVLGARITVPSLDGPLSVKVPAGTQAGQRLRVSGRGVPRPSGDRGDLVLEMTIVIPRVVDERSKELMREFGRLNGEDVRRNLQI
jgi:molecular chaperone DnaJ